MNSSHLRYRSTEAVVARAYDQVGGVKQAMHHLGLQKTRAHAFRSPNAGEDGRKKGISFEQADRLTQAGATAFAEHLAARLGGRIERPGATVLDFSAAIEDEARLQGEATALLLRHADDPAKLSAAQRAKLEAWFDRILSDVAAALRKLEEFPS